MEEELRDHWLVCIECGHEFVFEVGEQKYYKSKGLLIPKHCPSCRKKKRNLLNREGTK